MKTLRIRSLNHFLMPHTSVSYRRHVVLYVPNAYLPFLKILSLEVCHFNHLPPLTIFQTLCPGEFIIFKPL